MGKIIMGFWRCPYCTTENNGPDDRCKNCGRSKPKNVNFYINTSSPEVTDPEKIKEARKGPSWYCSHCDGINDADREQCQNCGATRPGEEDKPIHPVYRVPIIEKPRRVPPRSGSSYTSHIQDWQISLGAMIFFKLAALFLFGLVVWIFSSHNVDLTVTGFKWERSISVDAYRTVVESDWYIPSGGRLISQRTELYGYEQVPYQEPVYRSQPIYKIKYTYEIEKWVQDRVLSLNGTTQEAAWPEVYLASNERENRVESYRVIFSDKKGKVYELSVTLDEWGQYDLGQSFEVKVNNLGQITENPLGAQNE